MTFSKKSGGWETPRWILEHWVAGDITELAFITKIQAANHLFQACALPRRRANRPELDRRHRIDWRSASSAAQRSVAPDGLPSCRDTPTQTANLQCAPARAPRHMHNRFI